MYELYAYPNTYAIGVHLLLHESGVQYQVIDVNESGALAENPVGGAHSAATRFTALSPHQRVPALQLPDGNSMCESGAIALYLGDSLSDAQFSIEADNPNRTEYLQWLFYLSSTLQSEVMLQFHPEYYFDDPDSQDALKVASQRRLDKIWSILEARYHRGPWMFEDRPTAVDFSLATVLLWPECFPAGTNQYPNLQKTLNAIQSREACREVIRWHKRETSMTGRPALTTSR